MKLYLSSYRIPETKSLQDLLEKPLDETTVALIPNAKDYYSELAWKYKVQSYVDYFQNFGMTVNVVDLREYDNSEPLSNELRKSDLIWAAGGNTICLRYEMKRSGFEGCIRELLTEGKVYGGDSAGALVAGVSLRGIEKADIPEFASKVLPDGLGLVPYMILPHLGNPEFTQAMEHARLLNKQSPIIELTDTQAVIFMDNEHRVVEGEIEVQLE